ncbi:MAG: DNA repair protein RadA [Patescibacteria group bacterium]
MSNKIQTVYVCSSCDAQSIKWSGRCLECGAWGTLQMQTIDQKLINNKITTQVAPAEIIDLNKLPAISGKNNSLDRLKTNIGEIDRVFGNGLMPGSLILLAGEPGIGKSTLVAQIASTLNVEIAYVSGEESANQIKDRFERLKIKTEKIKFLNETNVEKIIGALKQINPRVVIIDSIQTIYSSLVPSEAGGINQIRACAVSFLEIAKKDNIAIILIGHVTKDGVIAGPKSLEHIVDTVIYLETETAHNYRILRATKNRFGSINELGIFEMTAEGFIEIKNPSQVFIEGVEQNISGSVISCIMEGSRPFLVEIQALVTKTVFGYPQRRSSGFDLNRLQILIAILTKKANINLANQDVVLNIAGGLKVDDPALDLAICSAIVSSLLNQTIDRKILILGEVGLGGEVRRVNKLETRLTEATKLGFNQAIIPNSDCQIKEIILKKIKNISEFLNILTKK